jgi:Glycosyltransferase
LETGLRFVGYIDQDDQALWYAAATMFVFPSLYEGFGMPPLEAMACGTPVIVSNSSSLPEVVGATPGSPDQAAALIVPPDDADALAQAMLRLLADAGLRAELRARGLARARCFSWRTTAERTRRCIALRRWGRRCISNMGMLNVERSRRSAKLRHSVARPLLSGFRLLVFIILTMVLSGALTASVTVSAHPQPFVRPAFARQMEALRPVIISAAARHNDPTVSGMDDAAFAEVIALVLYNEHLAGWRKPSAVASVTPWYQAAQMAVNAAAQT